MCILTKFHFTDENGYNGIKKTMKIRTSRDFYRDASYGEGVYLQNKSPFDSTKEEICRLCWGGSSEVTTSKVRYVIEVHMPDTKLRDCHDRNIWVSEQEIDLECCEHYFYRWDENVLKLGGCSYVQKEYRKKYGIEC